ncbi:MAG: hypothetical protein FJ006_12095 [Chloroflexi bacterium]|nr:hypothetical protein [Chloroflexota bacterium]
MRALDTREVKELLNKCWMTHDAMWFYHCLQECGIEKANKINRAAMRAMATIEIRRIKNALGVTQIENFEVLRSMIECALDLVTADFMGFMCSFHSEGFIHWEMPRCFAYNGMKKIGVIGQYQCGVLDRFEGWLDSLGIKYSVTPQVAGCMMHTEGRCFRDYRFYF